MGIDVEMMARSSDALTDQDVDALALAFAEEFGPPDDYGYPVLKRADEWDEPERTLRIDTLDRYYGPHYSRGRWPLIRAMGDWLMLRFGEAGEVRYGGDTSYGWDELTPYPPQRAECEEHWLTRGHAPYREACNCDHCSTLPSVPSGSYDAGGESK